MAEKEFVSEEITKAYNRLVDHELQKDADEVDFDLVDHYITMGLESCGADDCDNIDIECDGYKSILSKEKASEEAEQIHVVISGKLVALIAAICIIISTIALTVSALGIIEINKLEANLITHPSEETSSNDSSSSLEFEYINNIMLDDSGVPTIKEPTIYVNVEQFLTDLECSILFPLGENISDANAIWCHEIPFPNNRKMEVFFPFSDETSMIICFCGSSYQRETIMQSKEFVSEEHINGRVYYMMQRTDYCSAIVFEDDFVYELFATNEEELQELANKIVRLNN